MLLMNPMDTKRGIIFDIQRFSVHDGTGIRTNVFFKGCPLCCDWCCNPESQKPYPQPMYDKAKCIGCGNCAQDCARHAISREGAYTIDTELCASCPDPRCVSRCFSRALTMAGRAYTVEEIICIVQRDAAFYGTSGGGITISGGEAVLQADFLEELLRACKERQISTAMETCSAGGWEQIRRTMPYVDTYLCDVKHTDPEKFRRETGGEAEKVLGNIRKLAGAGGHIIARVPMIPGFNTGDQEVEEIGRFIASCGIRRVEVLNFHKLGVPKYEKCFMRHRPKEREPLELGELERKLMIFRRLGLEAETG